MYCSIVLFFLVRLLQFVSPKSSPFSGPLGATWQAQRWQLGLLPNTNKNHNSLNKSYPHSIQTLWHITLATKLPPKPHLKKHQRRRWNIEPQHKIITSNIQTYTPWNPHFPFFPSYWECHHPNWRTHIFQRGRYTTNQVNTQPSVMFSYVTQTHMLHVWNIYIYTIHVP